VLAASRQKKERPTCKALKQSKTKKINNKADAEKLKE